MCLLIIQTPGHTIPTDHLIESWSSNSDGGGFAYIDSRTGLIEVEKYMHLPHFLTAYADAVTNNPDSPIMLHMRFATHGVTDESNVHPFWMDDHTVVGHNGVINCLMKRGDDRSDTKTFVEDYLADFPEGWLDSPQWCDLVEDYITGSKLAMLTTDPALLHDYYILNEDKGHWLYETDSDGKRVKVAWYSNSTYQPTIRKTVVGGKWEGSVGGWQSSSYRSSGKRPGNPNGFGYQSQAAIAASQREREAAAAPSCSTSRDCTESESGAAISTGARAAAAASVTSDLDGDYSTDRADQYWWEQWDDEVFDRIARGQADQEELDALMAAAYPDEPGDLNPEFDQDYDYLIHTDEHGNLTWRCQMCDGPCHHDVLCFDCDWCQQCSTDIWDERCRHSGTAEADRAYMEWITGRQVEDVEVVVARSDDDDPADDDTALDPPADDDEVQAAVDNLAATIVGTPPFDITYPDDPTPFIRKVRAGAYI